MPSERYSLVPGRPTLILGSGAAGGGGTATPGARLASEMKLRPFEGKIHHPAIVDDMAKPGRLAAQE
jgi:hypothetical protein